MTLFAMAYTGAILLGAGGIFALGTEHKGWAVEVRRACYWVMLSLWALALVLLGRLAFS